MTGPPVVGPPDLQGVRPHPQLQRTRQLSGLPCPTVSLAATGRAPLAGREARNGCGALPWPQWATAISGWRTREPRRALRIDSSTGGSGGRGGTPPGGGRHMGEAVGLCLAAPWRVALCSGGSARRPSARKHWSGLTTGSRLMSDLDKNVALTLTDPWKQAPTWGFACLRVRRIFSVCQRFGQRPCQGARPRITGVRRRRAGRPARKRGAASRSRPAAGTRWPLCGPDPGRTRPA